ncbi:MAG: ATP synthase F1 subunit delta [Phycisphaerae bacterium]|nr:ATP synthase F1 subunit delta [Phycisphaerae bacterium]
MAESFDEQLEVADVYAEALFALATDAGTVEAVRNELDELVRLVELEPGLAAFLSSGAVDDDERAASLERMFRGRLSDLVLNTLQVMNNHGRVHLLPPLLRCFELRQEQAAGQIEVRATSAVKLNKKQKAEVLRVATELSGKEPLVDYAVDPELIGGLVLQIGDYRFDSSIRQQLRAARAKLLERGSRGVGTETIANG